MRLLSIQARAFHLHQSGYCRLQKKDLPADRNQLLLFIPGTHTAGTPPGGKGVGFLEVPAGEEKAFLKDRPVQEMSGIAKNRQRSLAAPGALTFGHVANLPSMLMKQKFGIWGQQLGQQFAGGTARPAAHFQRRQLIRVDGRWQARLDRRRVDDQAPVFQFQLPSVPQAQVVAIRDRHLHLHDRGAQIQQAPIPHVLVHAFETDGLIFVQPDGVL